MRFLNGLHTDTEEIAQPEGTYPEMRNGLIHDKIGALSREHELEEVDTLSENIISYLYISDDNIILFLSQLEDKIVQFDGSSITEIFGNNDLLGEDLDFGNELDAEYRTLYNGDLILYWTDDTNPPRRLNITKCLAGNKPDSLSELKLFPSTNSPAEFTLDDVRDSGGELKCGSYELAFAYEDEDSTITNFFLVTNPIYISDPDTGYGGDREKVAGKSIRYTLDNLDTSYDYLRVASIRDTTVELLPRIPIRENSQTFVYSGTEEVISGSLDEVVINNVSYSKAKTLTQLGNVLYLGNLERPSTLDYQKYANNIKVEVVSKDIANNTLNIDGETSTNKSFQRDEVYALYISLVKKDGSESPAYHIPGRTSNGATDYDSTITVNSQTEVYPDTSNITTPAAQAGETHVLEWSYDGGNQTDTVTINFSENKSQAETAQEYKNATESQTDWAITLVLSNFFTQTTVPGIQYEGTFTIDIDGSEVRNEAIVGSNTYTITIDSEATNIDITGTSSVAEEATEIFNSLSNNSNLTDASGPTFSFSQPSNDSIKISTPDSSVDGSSPQLSGTLSTDTDLTITPFDGSQGEVADLSGGHVLSSVATKEYQVENFPDGTYNTGYWRNFDETYPDDEDWDIWDSNGDTGNTLRNGPVRHHRMPDRDNEEIFSGSIDAEPTLSILGIKLHDLYFPPEIREEIVGYKIYYAKRGTEDRINLLNSRSIFGFKDDATNYGYNPESEELLSGTSGAELIPNGHDTDFTLHSETNTDWTYDRSVLYLHPFSALKDRRSISGANFVKYFPDYGDQANISRNLEAVNAKSYVDLNESNIKLTQLGFTNDMDNTLGESKVVVELDSALTRDEYAISLCQVRENIYQPFDQQLLAWTGLFSSDLNSTTSPEIYGGDTFVTQSNFKSNFVYPYLDKVSSGSSNAYADGGHGDKLQREYEVLLTPSASADEDNAFGLQNAFNSVVGVLEDFNSIPLPSGYLFYDVQENIDNPWKRIQGENVWETFHPLSNNAFISNSTYGFKYDGVTHPNWLTDAPDVDNLDSQIDQSEVRGEWYYRFFTQADNLTNYNELYSAEGDTKPASPYLKLQVQDTKFPTRVIRSESDPITGRNTSFRVFKDSDFVDLPFYNGDLIRLDNYNDDLIMHMEKDLLVTRGREELVVGDSRAYLGAGDIFSAEPKEIFNLETGYGGISSINHSEKTPYGYFFLDLGSGQVFNLDQGDISSNIVETYIKELDPLGKHFLGFDSKEDRVIISSQNKSQSISYQADIQKWASFHDYYPDLIIQSTDQSYFTKDKSIYKFGTGYGSNPTVSGNPLTFKLRIIDNKDPLMDKIAVSCTIDLEILDINGDWVRDIFDTFQIRNSYQDSGLIALTPFLDESGNETSNPNIRRVSNTWRINSFRDSLNNYEASGNSKRFVDKWHEVEVTYDPNGIQSRNVKVYNINLYTRPSRR